MSAETANPAPLVAVTNVTKCEAFAAPALTFTLVDVVANPELLEGKFAADCSVWFWKILGPQGVKNFPKKANEGATEAVVTKISRWVNGGDNGLADRKEKFAYYWSVLEKNASAYS